MATEVIMPKMGLTMTEGTVVRWLKQVGEPVTAGEPLLEIETDKVMLTVEAQAAGALLATLAEEGERVPVARVIGYIGRQGEELPAATAGPAPATAPAQAAADPPAAAAGGGERVKATPLARRLARQHGIDLAAVEGSGPGGRIVEADVQRAIAAQAPAAEAHQVPPATLTASGPEGAIVERDVRAYLDAQAAPAAAGRAQVGETIPFAGVRAAIAERMLASTTSTARVTLTAEADASELVALRRRLGEAGADVPYNALFLRILAHTLREHPRLNASLEGDAIRLWSRIDIGLAVDTERGLLVPVVREVDRKGLAQLAEEVRALAERARSGRCTPAELSGGTFTLANLGMFGVDSFTPIINLPECAILGVGRITMRPAAVAGEVVARPMVWLSLSFDHRLVDGAPAARFLARVVQLVACPYLLLS